jgi:hypothetical protein
VKRSFFSTVLAVTCALLFCCLLSEASGASAGLVEHPTNAALVEGTLSRAVETLLRGMPVSVITKPVILTPSVAHEANWMVENLLGGRLREEGVAVVISRFKAPPPAFQPEAPPYDTTGAADTVAMAQPQDEPKEAHVILEYRIVELGMEYPRVWRAGYVGRKVLERYAYASVHARLIDEQAGTLMWAGEGKGSQSDVVPVAKLALIEGSGEDWQKGTLPPGKLGGMVEPLVVAAIVAGLVYLFYSNKE